MVQRPNSRSRPNLHRWRLNIFPPGRPTSDPCAPQLLGPCECHRAWAAGYALLRSAVQPAEVQLGIDQQLRLREVRSDAGGGGGEHVNGALDRDALGLHDGDRQ